MVEKTFLVVDPSESDRETTVQLLASEFPEANVLAAGSYQRGTHLLAEQTVDTLVTRYALGERTGIELTAHVRDEYPDTDCVLFAESREVETESFEEIIVEFVPRGVPAAEDTLVSLIQQAETVGGQVSYPLPNAEQERLAALDRYPTDSPRVAAALKRITELVRTHFGGSTTSVSFLDERTQRILARSGDLSPPTVRESSLATHTIVQTEPVMAVGNVSEDTRFVDDRLQASDIRAYLGAKVETVDGHVLGTVNVYLDEPHQFSKPDQEYLATLASLATDVLELGRTEQTRRKDDEREGQIDHDKGERL